MKVIKLRLLFIFVLFISVLSCKKEEKIKNEPPELPYFTFGEVGNEWIFERIFWFEYDSLSTVTIDTVFYKIVEYESDNIYKYTKERQSNIDTLRWYISNNEFGTVSNNGEITIFVKSNSQAGDVFSEEIGVWEEHRIESINEQVIIENDTLECFLVKDCEVCDDHQIKYYINNQFGIIKEVFWSIHPVSNRVEYKLINKNFN